MDRHIAPSARASEDRPESRTPGLVLIEEARRASDAIVKPPPFRYSAPTSVAAVLDELAAHVDEEPRVLAGGQSLVPLMNFRLAQPGYLVDLRRVEELSRITLDGDVLTVGAMVRQSVAEHSADVGLAAPLLAEALTYVAHPSIRNRGTVGGSIAHADPSAELPAAAVALHAEMIAAGPGGRRVIPADEFFDGPFSCTLRPEEILAEIRIPRQDGGQSFVEFTRTNGSFALVGVGTAIGVVDNRIAHVSIAMSGVGPTPVRAAAAEQILLDAAPDDDTVRAAADAAADALTPSGDIHASTQSRIALARSYVRRGIQLALSRTENGR